MIMIKFIGDKNSKYEVKRVDTRNVNTLDEYKKSIHSATTVFCDSLTDVWEFCGGKLHRERCGYSGVKGNFEYIAVRIWWRSNNE